MNRLVPSSILLTLLVSNGSASLILDRAPNARAIAELFIDRGGTRVEWVLKDGAAQPELLLTPDLPGAPGRLRIGPPQGAGDEEIAVVVYHLGLPVSDLHYLTAEQTILLDWQDPWRSRFEDPRLRRAYESPVGVFLFVGRYEVRVEVMGRPADFGLESIDAATIEDRIREILDGRWRLTIDGEDVVPPLIRCEFLERRLRSTLVTHPPEPGAVRSATIGVVYSQKRVGYPDRVQLQWDYFPPEWERLSASVTEDGLMEPAVLRREKNTLTWERGGRALSVRTTAIPPAPGASAPLLRLLSLAGALLLALLLFSVVQRLRAGHAVRRAELLFVFVGGVLVAGGFVGSQRHALSESEVGGIADALLENVYSSFLFPDEEAIYDALERSVSGDLLRDTYLEVRRSLEVERADGVQIKVNDVTVETTDSQFSDAGNAIRTHARWAVSGSVAHWGHLHRRRNVYEGELRITPVDGAWKLTGLQLLNEERSVP